MYATRDTEGRCDGHEPSFRSRLHRLRRGRLFAVAAAARAAPLGARDSAFEQQISRELDAIAPDATPIFQRATAAFDARDYTTAAALFKDVLDHAPGFAHAERRECGAIAAGGHPEDAVALCRAALAHKVSPPNEAALAAVLLDTTGAPSSLAVADAKRLAIAAVEAEPDDPYYVLTALRASLQDNDLPRAKIESDRLERLAPDDPMAGYLCAVTAAETGDLDRATTFLARARANGLPDEAATSLTKAIDDARAGPPWLRVVKGFGVVMAVWFGILVFLLGAGYALSRATLRAIAARPTAADVRPYERRLRKAYRAVLWGACAYYYGLSPRCSRSSWSRRCSASSALSSPPDTSRRSSSSSSSSSPSDRSPPSRRACSCASATTIRGSCSISTRTPRCGVSSTKSPRASARAPSIGSSSRPSPSSPSSTAAHSANSYGERAIDASSWAPVFSKG